MITRGRAGVLILLSLLALAACREPSAPAQSTVAGTTIPPETPSSSSATAASPSPTLPSAASHPTRSGAEAFATYFFAVYNYAFWTGDPQALRAVSDIDCVYCRSTEERISALRSKRNRLEGGRIEVATAVAAPGQPASGIVVNLILRQEASRTVSESGDLVGSAPPVANGRMDLAVTWRGDHWVLLDAHVYRDGES